MLSKKSKISLAQFLELYSRVFSEMMLKKHSIKVGDGLSKIEFLQISLLEASDKDILSLLREMVSTQKNLISKSSDKDCYNERWNDLLKCLALDGIDIQDDKLIPVDSFDYGTNAISDDLYQEIEKSGLNQDSEIIDLLEKSADDFMKEPPDYNGCLSNARVALQTLTTEIALKLKNDNTDSFAEGKWGQVISFLRKKSIINEKEEDGLTGVYSFLSSGAHRPVGLDEKEMARLGRSLAVGMCYFIVKCYNAK